jgi:hypothetical protein
MGASQSSRRQIVIDFQVELGISSNLIKVEMGKDKCTTAKQWRLRFIYRKEQVDSFWSKTDANTRRSVFSEGTLICMLTPMI